MDDEEYEFAAKGGGLSCGAIIFIMIVLQLFAYEDFKQCLKYHDKHGDYKECGYQFYYFASVLAFECLIGFIIVILLIVLCFIVFNINCSCWIHCCKFMKLLADYLFCELCCEAPCCVVVHDCRTTTQVNYFSFSNAHNLILS